MSITKALTSDYVYLASPYSHADPAVMEWRYKQACLCAAWMMKSNHHNVFSPIAHSHPIFLLSQDEPDSGRAPNTWEFWKRQDYPMVFHAKAMYVLKLDGWDKSRGVNWEIGMAEGLGKDVCYYDWGTTYEDLRPQPL